jgi:hypothetical protein
MGRTGVQAVRNKRLSRITVERRRGMIDSLLEKVAYSGRDDETGWIVPPAS